MLVFCLLQTVIAQSETTLLTKFDTFFFQFFIVKNVHPKIDSCLSICNHASLLSKPGFTGVFQVASTDNQECNFHLVHTRMEKCVFERFGVEGVLYLLPPEGGTLCSFS